MADIISKKADYDAGTYDDTMSEEVPGIIPPDCLSLAVTSEASFSTDDPPLVGAPLVEVPSIDNLEAGQSFLVTTPLSVFAIEAYFTTLGEVSGDPVMYVTIVADDAGNPDTTIIAESVHRTIPIEEGTIGWKGPAPSGSAAFFSNQTIINIQDFATHDGTIDEVTFEMHSEPAGAGIVAIYRNIGGTQYQKIDEAAIDVPPGSGIHTVSLSKTLSVLVGDAIAFYTPTLGLMSQHTGHPGAVHAGSPPAIFDASSSGNGPVVGADITTVVPETFSFTTPASLAPGTYWAVFQSESGTPGGNLRSIRTRTPSAYTGGHLAFRTNTDPSWFHYPNHDLTIIVHVTAFYDFGSWRSNLRDTPAAVEVINYDFDINIGSGDANNYINKIDIIRAEDMVVVGSYTIPIEVSTLLTPTDFGMTEIPNFNWYFDVSIIGDMTKSIQLNSITTNYEPMACQNVTRINHISILYHSIS